MAEPKLLFIDTSVFVASVFGDAANSILDELLKRLEKKDIVIILPEVIKNEIKTQFDILKNEYFEECKKNLSINKIVGIDEEKTKQTEGKKKVNQKGTNSKTIDECIRAPREKLLANIEKYYKDLSKKIEVFFRHRNIVNIPLTDKLLLSGMKRSLLKKAPYTNIEKTTESAHTKDADCIAFESIIFYIKSLKTPSKNSVILCVSDKDYHSKDGRLHDDICKDLEKCKFESYKSLAEMLEITFRTTTLKTSKDGTGVKMEERAASIAGPSTGIDSAIESGEAASVSK